MSKEMDFQTYKDLLKEGLCRYTRQAFEMIPALNKPRILDVGCGAGVPTLELARLSGGEVVGLDIDQSSLDRFAARIEKAGLSGRVRAVKCSMRDMDFPDGSFDIIWAEGSTFVVGFEKALKEWRCFLKPGGFLVAHEMIWSRPDPPPDAHKYWKGLSGSGIRTVPEYLEPAAAGGYDLVGHFTLEGAWWTEYYGPLEDLIKKLRPQCAGDPGALEVLDSGQRRLILPRSTTNGTARRSL